MPREDCQVAENRGGDGEGSETKPRAFCMSLTTGKPLAGTCALRDKKHAAAGTQAE